MTRGDHGPKDRLSRATWWTRLASDREMTARAGVSAVGHAFVTPMVQTASRGDARSPSREEIQNHLQSEITAATAQLVSERGRQEQRRNRLPDERQELLQPYDAGAVPVEVLKAEQDRIAQELAAAELYFHDANT